MTTGTDGSDLLFAGAAAIWGGITVYRSVLGWREESRRSRSSPSVAVNALPMGKLDLPAAVVAGSVITLGSVAYLVYSILL